MPRANRHFIPGQIWHITHRCHQRDFLLKLLKDRQRWVDWLREAKLRHGITVFNYVVTSNHIHLLLFDNLGQGAIPQAIQLVVTHKRSDGYGWQMRAGGIYLAIKRFIRSHERRCFSLRRLSTLCHSRLTFCRKAPMARLFMGTPEYLTCPDPENP